MNRRALCLSGLLGVILCLAACRPVSLPEATPIPTQPVWQISYPSELAWTVDDFGSCLDNTWNTSVIIGETQDLQSQSRQADVMLFWGDVDPQGLPAYQIGEDHIIVVVNPQLQLKDLSEAGLLSIYEGKVQDWSEMDGSLEGEIHGWIYPEHLGIRQAFETSLGGLESISPFLGIAPDVFAMIEAVSADPLAIGFLPASWPEHNLKTVTVTDWDEAVVPVVALTRMSEDEKLSAWLKCLSGKFTNP